MNEHDVLKKNHNFYIGVGGTVLEGLLSGSLFIDVYKRQAYLKAKEKYDTQREKLAGRYKTKTAMSVSYTHLCFPMYGGYKYSPYQSQDIYYQQQVH